jgi:Golgi phosphoprotein 3
MATSGLSRRRAAGGGANSPNGTTSSPQLGSAGGSNLNGGNSGSSRATTPGSLQQQHSSHKVAYDERDMESQEDKIMPKLTLMEEILLLGLKDKQVSLLPLCP